MNGKIANAAQCAYLRRYTLTDGAEAGLRVIEIYNGRLRALLNESRALDILQLFDGEYNLSFVSKNGFVADARPFSRRFEGGMLYTVGLDSAGGRAGYETHGTLHILPARVTALREGADELSVTAEIRDTELFGKDLLLRRTVSVRPGGDTLTVRDTLENRGTRAENYCLLYHVNLGYPMLDAGVTVCDEAEEVIPRTPYAAARLADRTTFSEPVDNEEERCYFIRHRTPAVSVHNPRIGRTFRLAWSGDTLPCFVQWNSAASGDYALGVEPSTTFLDDRFAYSVIAPGARVHFSLSMTLSRA